MRHHVWIIVSGGEWVGSGNDCPLVFGSKRAAKEALDSYLVKAHIEKVELTFESDKGRLVF